MDTIIDFETRDHIAKHIDTDYKAHEQTWKNSIERPIQGESDIVILVPGRLKNPNLSELLMLSDQWDDKAVLASEKFEQMITGEKVMLDDEEIMMIEDALSSVPNSYDAELLWYWDAAVRVDLGTIAHPQSMEPMHHYLVYIPDIEKLQLEYPRSTNPPDDLDDDYWNLNEWKKIVERLRILHAEGKQQLFTEEEYAYIDAYMIKHKEYWFKWISRITVVPIRQPNGEMLYLANVLDKTKLSKDWRGIYPED